MLCPPYANANANANIALTASDLLWRTFCCYLNPRLQILPTNQTGMKCFLESGRSYLFEAIERAGAAAGEGEMQVHLHDGADASQPTVGFCLYYSKKKHKQTNKKTKHESIFIG